jgi:hypothetical protein
MDEWKEMFKGIWEENKLLMILAAVILIAIIASSIENIDQKSSQTPVTTSPEVKEEPIPTDTVSQIEYEIDKVGDFEVTVWTMDGNFAHAESTPPFEVIVNTTSGDIDDCFDAKHKLFETMKAVYSDAELKNNVARVKFTAWGQLKGSLGSSDAIIDWSSTGLSNFWTVMQQYNSYEDETGSMDTWTYGVRINNSCD